MDIPNEPISTRKYKFIPETRWGKKINYKPAKIANIVESAEEKEKREKAFNYKYVPEAEERDRNIAEQMEMMREGGKCISKSISKSRSRSKSRSKTRRSKTRRSKTRRSRSKSRSKTRR